jgi:hypothetical protein
MAAAAVRELVLETLRGAGLEALFSLMALLLAVEAVEETGLLPGVTAQMVE